MVLDGKPLWRLREKVPGAQAEGALSSLGAQGEGTLSSEQQNMNGLGCGGEQDGKEGWCVSVRGGWIDGCVQAHNKLLKSTG